MTKFDQFIQRELESRLQADEKITTTGFLFNKSLGLIALVGPLALAGSGYFFAALTPRRLFLIKTSMGLFSLKMANNGVIVGFPRFFGQLVRDQFLWFRFSWDSKTIGLL
jgi:hypothetical protein